MASDPPLAPRPSPLPTVYLVDDDASYLRATARVLKASGFEVRPFVSPREFLVQLPADPAGCLIVDLRMPELDGLEVQAALARSDRELPVIFLTGAGDIPSSVRAMRGGAEDFLEKHAPRATLIAAVQRALEHDIVLRQTKQQRSDARTRFERLSEREAEVLSHVLRGALNKEIAGALGICERTVKLHRTHIKAKLGVVSVAEMAALAQTAGTFPKGQ
jgi:two-component system response regulator FixJ